MAEGTEAPPAPPAEEGKKRKKWLAVIVSLVVVLAAIGITAVLLSRPSGPPPGQVLDRVEVVPTTASIEVGQTKVYTARAFDGAGALIDFSRISVAWSVAPTALGAFNNLTIPNTVFTGAEVGTGTITATVTFERSTKAGTASVEVRPVPNWAAEIRLVGLPATAKVGASVTATVEVYDRFAQPYAGYAGTVTFSANPAGGASLPIDYSFVAADQGVHTFTGGLSFSVAGTYDVAVEDAANVSLSDTATIQVNPPQAPTARATATENQFTVTFDGSTSTDPDGTIASYAWDFGDAGTGTGPIVVHTYAGQGDYTVTLTVTDDDALTGTTTLPVRLWPPAASFAVAHAGFRVDVDASGTTDVDANVVSYAWDWGDGSPPGSGVTATHTYATEGSYTILLTVTDSDAFADTDSRTFALFRPIASFTASIPVDTVAVDASASTDDGTIVSYSWDWGDGSPAGSGVTAAHTYTTTGSKTITLTVTDDVGLQATATRTVTPRFVPVACFSVSTNFLDLAVDAGCTTDVDNNIASYAWEWGDGSPAGSGVTGAHTYAAPGTYTVTLNVTDGDGFWDAASRDVTVSGSLIPPIACFSLVVNGAQERIEVDGRCSIDSDGTVVSYAWDWGDGSPAGNGATASHAYAANGTYTVTLTITDDDGLTDTTSRTASWFPPWPCFTHTANGWDVSVDGRCSVDGDGAIASYAWNWGDGSPSGSGATASHTYGAAGTYTITLTVRDSDGFLRTTGRSVTFNPPTARFDVATVSFTISVDASASSDPDGTIIAYAWDWGDTSTGTGMLASHTYGASGRFTVRLTVTDDAGLTGTAQAEVSVNATSLDFTFYDFFNVPLDTWWTDPQQRQRVYGDVVLSNAYPYITWYPWAEDRQNPTGDDPFLYTMYRMNVVGQNLPGYSIDDPVLLPRFGADQPGGSVQVDLYMQYVSNTRRTQLSNAGCFINQGSMDGFIIEIQGTYKMNAATSRELFDVQGNPATWWPANTMPGCSAYGVFESRYENWLFDQGNINHDIYNAFEYTYSPWYTDITATYDAVSDVTTVTFHHIAWGGEVLYARWFYWGTTDYLAGAPQGWWGHELGWFEDWTFNATISTDIDFRLHTAIAYHMNNVGTVGGDNIWNTADDNSTWVWEPFNMDYLYRTVAHPRSELTAYEGRTYLHAQVGNVRYGTQYRYDYPPVTWNLRTGVTWTFRFPTNPIWFFDPFTSLETSRPADLRHYVAPMTFDRTTPLGLGTWDAATRTLRIVGPTNIVAPANPDFGQPSITMRPA